MFTILLNPSGHSWWNNALNSVKREIKKIYCEGGAPKAFDDGVTEPTVFDEFRDYAKTKTGLDVYAIGNMLLALVGTVGSAASVAAGIIAVPETGGASLVLSAFALVSLAFSAADLQQYWNDIYVGKEGSEYKYGTENTSYNIIYDGLFKGDVDAYNTVRSVADAGTLIFGFGLAYIKNINNPAKNIKDVAGKNNVNISSKLNFKNQKLLNDHYEKHGQEIAKALNKNIYSIDDYLADANYIVDNGTYVKELNGYVRFMAGDKYGFVGLDRVTGDITTFHIKTVSELIKKAPSLGF